MYGTVLISNNYGAPVDPPFLNTRNEVITLVFESNLSNPVMHGVIFTTINLYMYIMYIDYNL